MTSNTRSRSMSRLLTVLVTGLLAVGVLAACGGDDDDNGGGTATTAETTATETTPTTTETTETEATETETTETQAAEGKEVFTQNCGSCHTLADAGTQGQVGPNLDQAKPSASKVEAMVKSGGGAMPSFEGQLSEAQIKAVAAYVADAAGS